MTRFFFGCIIIHELMYACNCQDESHKLCSYVMFSQVQKPIRGKDIVVD